MSTPWEFGEPVGPVGGYYLAGPEGQPDPLRLYCWEHANRAAKLFNRLKGWRNRDSSDWKDARLEGVGPAGCWAGDDGFERCRICDILLDTGGISDSGIDVLFKELEHHGEGLESLGLDELYLLESSLLPGERETQVTAEIARRVQGSTRASE